MRHRTKLFLGTLGIAFLIYAASFGILAEYGGYKLLPSGNYRPLIGLMEPDTWIWQPAYGTFFSYKNASGERSIMANGIGYLYAPLILIEQNLFRPSHVIQQLSAEGYLEGKAFVPPLEELHPTWRNILTEAKASLPAKSQNTTTGKN